MVRQTLYILVESATGQVRVYVPRKEVTWRHGTARLPFTWRDTMDQPRPHCLILLDVQFSRQLSVRKCLLSGNYFLPKRFALQPPAERYGGLEGGRGGRESGRQGEEAAWQEKGRGILELHNTATTTASHSQRSTTDFFL